MENQNLFLRNDTFLGVCEAIGTDLGFHPNWLRVGFALALFFAPVATVAVYLALTIPVALSRYLYPVAGQQASTPVQMSGEVKQDRENDNEELPLAA